MKLHGYLEQMVGNRVSISVLRALIRYRGKIFTIRGLARDAGASHPRVSETVGELERLGIVQVQPVGRSHQVSLNEKSHVLKKIIEPMFAAEGQTFDQVVLILKRHLSMKKIASAAVFGSVSRGHEKEGSDVDVLVVSNDVDAAITAGADAGEEVFEKFHSRVSPLVVSESEFRSKGSGKLVRSILESHSMICGKGLYDVLK